MQRIFVDTSFLLGLADASDPYHDGAVELRAALKKGGYLVRDRDQLLTDLILNEVTQQTLTQRGYAAARDLRRQLQNSATVIQTTGRELQQAFDEICSRFGHHKHGSRGLSLVDGVTVVVMRRMRVGLLASTDEGFDPVPALRRVWCHNVDEICGPHP